MTRLVAIVEYQRGLRRWLWALRHPLRAWKRHKARRPQWVDITDRVLGGLPEGTGRCEIRLDNTDRKFDPTA